MVIIASYGKQRSYQVEKDHSIQTLHSFMALRLVPHLTVGDPVHLGREEIWACDPLLPPRIWIFGRRHSERSLEQHVESRVSRSQLP